MGTELTGNFNQPEREPPLLVPVRHQLVDGHEGEVGGEDGRLDGQGLLPLVEDVRVDLVQGRDLEEGFETEYYPTNF